MTTYLHHRTLHAPRRELTSDELARACLHQCHDDVAEAMLLQSRALPGVRAHLGPAGPDLEGGRMRDALLIALLLVLFGIAGRMDYEDALAAQEAHYGVRR